MTNSSKKRKTCQRNGDLSHRDDRSLDHSLIGETLNLGTKNVAQIGCALANGTEEVKDLLLNECNIIYECRHCRNMFRSFANLVTHKRAYCKGHECEQMALYDPSWFVPEQETKNTDKEVKVVSGAVTSIRPQTKSVTKLEQKKVFEAKRNSLHSIVNSLQKCLTSDDSVESKVISTSQFNSNEIQKDDEISNATQSQRLARQSLKQQTASPESGYSSIEESTLNTETSIQKFSGETFLSNKNETENIINPSTLKIASQMTSDHDKVEIMDESQLPANEKSSSSKIATSVTSTPLERHNKHRLNQQPLLKSKSSPNSVQKFPQSLEMKLQTFKPVKPVLSGSNPHYRNNLHHSIHSKEYSCFPISSNSSSSQSSSKQTDSNNLECLEQVCTQGHKSAISKGKNRRNDAQEKPNSKSSPSRNPIEVITIDLNNDNANSDVIYTSGN